MCTIFEALNRRLLRTRRERPCHRRTAEKRDDIAPSHGGRSLRFTPRLSTLYHICPWRCGVLGRGQTRSFAQNELHCSPQPQAHRILECRRISPKRLADVNLSAGLRVPTLCEGPSWSASLPRLVIVSNRVSVPDAAGKGTAGGLAVALREAFQAYQGLWFGWSGKVAAHPTTQPRVVDFKNSFTPMDIADNAFIRGLAEPPLLRRFGLPLQDVHCPFAGAGIPEHHDAGVSVLRQAIIGDWPMTGDGGRIDRPFLGAGVLEQHGAGCKILFREAGTAVGHGRHRDGRT